MTRTIIELPARFYFSTEISIRIGDINQGNHLSHVSLVSILEEARVQFLLQRGLTETGDNQFKIGIILTELIVVYKKQARYGQRLKIELAAANFSENSFDILYRVSDSEKGTEFARAKTVLLLFDYNMQKVIPIAPDIKDLLAR